MPRRILTWAVTVYGLLMTVHPAGWRTDLFHVAFTYLPARAWGLLFLVLGAVKLLRCDWWARALLAGALWGWGACLLTSVLLDLWHRRQPTSLAGWVWPAAIGLVIALDPTPPKGAP